MSRRGKLIVIAVFFLAMSIIFGVVSYHLWFANPTDFLLYFTVGSLLSTFLFVSLSKGRDPLDMSWRGIDRRALKYLILFWVILGLLTLHLSKYLYSDGFLFLAAWYTLGLGASITAIILSFISYYRWRGDQPANNS